MKDYSTVYSIQYTGTSCYTRTYCRLRLIVCMYAGYTCVQYLQYIPTYLYTGIYIYTVYTVLYKYGYIQYIQYLLHRFRTVRTRSTIPIYGTYRILYSTRTVPVGSTSKLYMGMKGMTAVE